ncbi:hypothetical protein FNF27_04053 [Cafeteria roenbergensis]|uniref:BRCT domain-containing protein n=1 Tax=Cafeteria roenbergensis TaxID=33653 RepID=A0A5A8ECH8_CAFRO|nr:hypothetical protein FNF27_04053 [Cafeteria roenbergensis]
MASEDADRVAAIFSKRSRRDRTAAKPVGEHHGNSFGTYFLHRQLKTDEQVNSGLKVVSSIFKGVRVYFNGAFSVRMATLHGLVVSNGGSVTWWKHDAAGRPTHLCTAGLTPAQVNEVMRMRSRPHVVVEAWVHECVRSGRRLPEADFIPEAYRRARTFAGGTVADLYARTTTSSSSSSSSTLAGPPDGECRAPAAPPGAPAGADPRRGPQPPEARRMPTARTTESDPAFLSQYYAKSRLHLLGEHKAKMQALVDDTQAGFARRLRAEGHAAEEPFVSVLPTAGEVALVQVQAQSIDEAFLDLTGCPDPEGAVSRLRAQIFRHTGCSASAGIARSKLLAKLACSAAKRGSGAGNAQLCLADDDGRVDAFLLGLRAYDLPGVGYKAMRSLRERGVETMAELAGRV